MRNMVDVASDRNSRVPQTFLPLAVISMSSWLVIAGVIWLFV